MSMERIDFISAYCDRWCERCGFTERCSSFAVHAAIVMCDGNLEDALALVVGRPRSVNGERESSFAERIVEDSTNEPPDAKTLEEFSRELDARDGRVEASPIAQASWDYAIAARRWLEERQHYSDQSPRAVHEALEIVSWDCCLIAIKLRRALSGRDEFVSGNPFDADAVQNDWNGSAKLSLILIERSTCAWSLVHDAFGDPGSAALRELLQSLDACVRAQFPEAIRFRRPGFDTCEEHP